MSLYNKFYHTFGPLKTIYNKTIDDNDIIIRKIYKTKQPSLTDYKLFINDVYVEFYKRPNSYCALSGLYIEKTNNGGWKLIYKELLNVSISLLDYIEHIIYEDLYRVTANDLPKVVPTVYKNKFEYYIFRNFWQLIGIELPSVFVEHFPQYKWML